LQVLLDESFKGNRWVVETDIANCFEAIGHDRLMQAVEERISDRQVLKLLRAMLRSGVMQDGSVRRTVTGTPQGGVISPLLANVYLHRLDRAWRPGEDGVLVRYADDLVVMCRTRSQAEHALARLTSLLADLGLEPKAAKTRLVQLVEGGEGVDFLGFHHRLVRARGRTGSRRIVFLAAGPHARRRSMPATGSGNSPIGPGCSCRSSASCRTSTRSCAAGPGISATATRLERSTRSALSPWPVSPASWPSGTSGDSGGAGS
jgi:group II intron reverse transcriptase/maturase